MPAPGAEWTWTLPFTIERCGGQFRIDPAFDLQAYAGVDVTKTYYVAVDGDDSNTGVDEAHPLRRVKTAILKADARRVLVKAGTYPYGYGWENAAPNHDLEVIGYGGDVVLSLHVEGLDWQRVDDHYEAFCASTIGSVVDMNNGEGVPLAYTSDIMKLSPGSWHQFFGVIFVRTADDRVPDAAIRCYVEQINCRLKYPVTYYLRNLQFHGGGDRVAMIGYGGAEARFYAENCDFMYSANTQQRDSFMLSGCGEAILMDCVAAYNSGDGYKAIKQSGQAGNLALIGCASHHNGSTSDSTNANGYSRHGNGNTVAVNCHMHHNSGPSMSDVWAGTLTWMLGCYHHDPASDASSYNYSISDEGSHLWLDDCETWGALLADVRAQRGATLHHRNMRPDMIASGDGVIVPY